METKLQKDRKIIDIFTMEVYDILSNLMLKCKELGINYTNVSKLEKGHFSSVKSRFTTPNHLNKVFILVDVDSGIEYNCIDNYGIFIQLNYPYNDKEGKYVYELKSGRQKHASICGRVFKLKGSIANKIIKTKNQSNYIDIVRNEAYKRKIIKYRISKRIWQSFKDIGHKKDNYTIDLLGCSMIFYIDYLKSKFSKGMTLDNYGKQWHIDHIKPVSYFNILNDVERKKAFHYTNTQPIWATSQIAKKYGEQNYIGNLNKNNNNIIEDYHLTNIISKTGLFENPSQLSQMLLKKGIKKVGF